MSQHVQSQEGGGKSNDARYVTTRPVSTPGGISLTIHNHFSGPGPVNCLTNVFSQPGDYNVNIGFGIPPNKERARNGSQMTQPYNASQGSLSSLSSSVFSPRSPISGVPSSQQQR